ncbi:unnamed protein product [Urochloa decumbens]|uniref:Uncharacterized protein n=1 Tax=Urochloa decumbens TaxID=240449 RepID=A0ABC9DC51_9POAL
MASSKAKKLPPFPALQLVSCQWALCFACLYAAVAYRAINHPSSSQSPRYRLPPAAALLRAQLWCSAPQAAAAALALLLPAGRRRRALALAALAAAAVNHGVLARLLGLLRGAAPPGDVVLLSVAGLVTCAALVTDLVGFLAILIGGQEG